MDDRLAHMIELQRLLQAHNFGASVHPNLPPEHLMNIIRTNVLACTDELHEALGETGWKPWATSNHLNVDAFKSELVDAWHFFMNLMLASGMTAEDLYDGYVAKRAVNVQRQEDGYDGKNKCPECKRAYDDLVVQCTPAGGGPAYCIKEGKFIEA